MLSCSSPAGWYASGDNKIAPSTWGYERGNVTSISSMSRIFTYDGENRQKTAEINGATSTYTYDGEGHRVKAQTPTGTTIFVYDAAGQLTAEYGPNTDTGTQYFTVDHLGSTRLVTGSAGAVDKCYDYLPFGETIPTTAGRSGTACYGAASGNRIDFTGKERDAESGLDYFLARYYSGAQGRFTSADEWAGGAVDPFTGQQVQQPGPVPYADIRIPQSLNKYAYVINNPLRYTDPDGHCFWDACVVESMVAATVATAVTGALLYSAQQLGESIGKYISSKQDNASDVPPVITPANSSKPGTRGKEDHQQTANEEAARIGGTREVRIQTPGGKKEARVADAVGTNPETGKPEIVQVIRPTKAGKVPKRELDAAQDIENATGIKPKLVPVRPYKSIESSSKN